VRATPTLTVLLLQYLVAALELAHLTVRRARALVPLSAVAGYAMPLSPDTVPDAEQSYFPFNSGEYASMSKQRE
jgi:hypothetical protein